MIRHTKAELDSMREGAGEGKGGIPMSWSFRRFAPCGPAARRECEKHPESGSAMEKIQFNPNTQTKTEKTPRKR